MRNLYVLGHPVAHSKSPAMHNALYREMGLDWRYELMDAPVEADGEAFLRAADFLGINITMPYKPHAFRRADWADASAVLAQGANVLVWEPVAPVQGANVLVWEPVAPVQGANAPMGEPVAPAQGSWASSVQATKYSQSDLCVSSGPRQLVAYNMDGYGCVRYLKREGVDFAGAAVVVCGTGPTSLAIMHAAIVAGAARMTLMGRDAARTQSVLDSWRDRAVGAFGAAGSARATDVRPVAGIRDADEPVSHDKSCAYDRKSSVGSGSLVESRPYRRTACRAQGADGMETELVACDYAGGADALSTADLIVDATPLGMHAGDPAPFDTRLLRPDTFVFDVVYGHGETALAAAARVAGCPFANGEGMLVGQAVLGAEKFLAAGGALGGAKFPQVGGALDGPRAVWRLPQPDGASSEFPDGALDGPLDFDEAFGIMARAAGFSVR